MASDFIVNIYLSSQANQQKCKPKRIIILRAQVHIYIYNPCVWLTEFGHRVSWVNKSKPCADCSHSRWYYKTASFFVGDIFRKIANFCTDWFFPLEVILSFFHGPSTSPTHLKKNLHWLCFGQKARHNVEKKVFAAHERFCIVDTRGNIGMW